MSNRDVVLAISERIFRLRTELKAAEAELDSLLSPQRDLEVFQSVREHGTDEQSRIDRGRTLQGKILWLLAMQNRPMRIDEISEKTGENREKISWTLQLIKKTKPKVLVKRGHGVWTIDLREFDSLIHQGVIE